MRVILVVCLASVLVGCADDTAAPETPVDREDDQVGDDATQQSPDDPATDDDAAEGEAPDQPERVFPEDANERTDQRRTPSGAGPGQITGTLGGDAQLEGGCVWIDTDAGRFEIAWPAGYTAETDPVRVLRDGSVVAEAGDRVTLHGRVQEDAMTICQVGLVFQATRVEGSG